LEQLDNLELQVLKALKDQQEVMAHREQMEELEIQDLLVRPVLTVHLDRMEIPVSRALRVQSVHLEQQDQLEDKNHKEALDSLAQLETQEYPERRVPQGLLVHRDHRVNQVVREVPDQLDQPETTAHLEHLE